jgi:signal transduction histidine kinase
MKASAGLASTLVEKLGDLEGAVNRQSERFAAVLELGTRLAHVRDLDELLRQVIDQVATLLGAEAATLFMHDADRGELWARVVKGGGVREIRVPASRGIAGHVLASGQSLRVSDAYEDARFNPEVDRKSGFRTRSILAAPLRHVSGRILGVVEVLHRKPGMFGGEDLQLVEAVAAQIAGALDNMRLVDQLRWQNEALRLAQEEAADRLRELDVLYQLEKAVLATEEETDLLDRILAMALQVSGARAGAVLLCEEDQGTLYFRSARGEKSDVLTQLRLEPGKGVAGQVALSGQAMRLIDAADSPHYDRSVARKLGVAVGSLLAVPIPGQRGRLGALELLNKKGGFTEADERLATLLAGQAGRAILQRRAREEGERKARLATIGQLLAGVLHDLRTPMTVISGYVQLLAMGATDEERKEWMALIDRQFEHIHAMTRETLAFARGESALLVRKVFLHRFIEEVETFLRKDLEGSGVELRVLPGYTGTARFDEVKIKRCIYNIARNAVQALGEGGGRFTLSVEKESRALVFKLSDNGPGIPEEIAETLFEEFVTAGKKGGTGLGLAIVKRIAEEHAGTISFRSRPGKGTTFELRLPQRD